jgi:hypothetical protein
MNLQPWAEVQAPAQLDLYLRIWNCDVEDVKLANMKGFQLSCRIKISINSATFFFLFLGGFWILEVYFIYTSLACAVGPSVTTSSTDFSFQNLVFWNLFEFSAAEIT